MSDDLVKRLREVIGNKLDYTTTPNHLLLTAADRVEELEDKLARAVGCLESIAANTCCNRCREAALVARTTLAELKGEDRG